MTHLLRFAVAYLKSMRLYYAFVTGLVGWLGVSYYDYALASGLDPVASPPSPSDRIATLVILFLAWGVNQIFNDYLGLPEDRINAPHRPMVTGELNARAALIVSAALVLGTGAYVALGLRPVALVPYVAGVVLNFVYEWAKGHGLLGNLVFGLMIGTAPVFGYLASGPASLASLHANAVSLFGLVVILSGIMTYYTYFKDREGDEAAGKRTLVVALGLERARQLGLALGLLPALLFAALYGVGWLDFALTPLFGLLGALSVLLQLWNAVLFYLNPRGQAAYTSLDVNFRAYCCAFAALIGLYAPQVGLVLFLVSYVLIEFLFRLHSDERA